MNLSMGNPIDIVRREEAAYLASPPSPFDEKTATPSTRKGRECP
jgi:hypothetical protein